MSPIGAVSDGADPQSVGRSPSSVSIERGQQFVQRRRRVERGQPHLARRRADAVHPAHQHVEHGVGRPARRDRLGRLVGSVGGQVVARGEVAGLIRQHLVAGLAAIGPDTRRLGVRTGDVGGLEPGEPLRALLEVAVARGAGQLVRVGHAEDDPALHRREGPQAHSIGEVGVQPAQLAFLEALRGQQQMHAERTPQSPDHHEQIDEVRLGGEQFTELVDDDEQRRHRLERRALLAGPLVVAQRGEVAGAAQRLLPADQFAVHGVAHPVDEDQLVLEVGDDGGGVRQHVEARERRAALEVDEDEVQRLGRMRQGQPQHEGAQQFGLARTRRADDQPVRAHPALRGLLDVELDRMTAGTDADRYPEPVARCARPPRRPSVSSSCGSPRRSRSGRLRSTVSASVGSEVVVDIRMRAHPPRQQLRLDDAQRVRDAERHALFGTRRVAPHDRQRAGTDLDRQARRAPGRRRTST